MGQNVSFKQFLDNIIFYLFFLCMFQQTSYRQYVLATVSTDSSQQEGHRVDPSNGVCMFSLCVGSPVSSHRLVTCMWF